MSRSLHIFFAILLVAIACDYEPDIEKVTLLSPVSLEGMYIEIEGYPDPQIEISEYTEISYKIVNNNRGQLLYQQAFFDNIIVASSVEWLTGSISLDPSILSDGEHTLRIEAKITSGTGSLAELTSDQENVVISTERKIVIHNPLPTADDAVITSVEIVDRVITIHWKPWEKFNFESYRLYRQDYDDNGTFTNEFYLGEFHDQDKSSLRDSVFMYGKSTYTLKARINGQDFLSQPFPFELSYQPGIEATIGLDGNLMFKWNDLQKLNDNVSTYRAQIRRSAGDIYYGTFYLNPVTPGDTIVTTNIPEHKFGDHYEVVLDFFDANNNLVKNYYDPRWFMGGKKFAMYNNTIPLHYDQGTGHFYGQTDLFSGQLVKISPEGESVDSIDGKIETIAYARGSSIAYFTRADNLPFKLDLATMSELSFSTDRMKVLGVSDNGRILIYRNDEAQSEIISETGDLLYILGSTYNPTISPDGKYATNAIFVYRDNGTGYEDWADFAPPASTRSISYLSDPSMIVIASSSNVKIYNIETKTVEHSASGNYTCNYDPVSDKIGCRRGNDFVIFNTDLSVHKTIAIDSNLPAYLLNATVLCPGIQIALSDIP